MRLKEFYNADAEKSVLRSLMSDDNEDCLTVAELKPADFFIQDHQRIFKGIQYLVNKSINPEQLAVVTLAIETNGVELVAAISEIMAEEGGNHNFKYHQKIVKDNSRKRMIQRTIENMQVSLYEAGEMEEIEAMLTQSTDKLLSVGMAQGNSLKHIRDIAGQTMQHIEVDRGEIRGTKTGLVEFDRMISGLNAQEFIVVGARPSMGKTAFALNLVLGAAGEGAIIAVYSLEMGEISLMLRMLSAKANINSKTLKKGGSALTDEQWMHTGIALGEMSQQDIYISDASGVTVHKIKNDMAKLRKMNPGRKIICMIDYLQLVHGSKQYAGNRQQEISEISRTLKDITRTYDMNVVALSQLSRQVEQRQDKRPMMSDLRESGSIEQDADIIGFLYRDDYYDKESEARGLVELIIAKNREGEVGTVELAFIKEYGKMVDLERRFH